MSGNTRKMNNNHSNNKRKYTLFNIEEAICWPVKMACKEVQKIENCPCWNRIDIDTYLMKCQSISPCSVCTANRKIIQYTHKLYKKLIFIETPGQKTRESRIKLKLSNISIENIYIGSNKTNFKYWTYILPHQP